MSVESEHAAASLQLKTVPHPARPGETALFFSDWPEACGHLRDHLLSSPECQAWALVVPSYLDVLDPADEDARWSYAQRAFATQGVDAQPLYDVYLLAVTRDMADASILAWYRSEGSLTVGMGTSGVLVIIDHTVRTAFLAGQGDAQRTRAARQAVRPGGLPRESGMRRKRPGRWDHRLTDRECRVRERREASWTAPQRLYFHVFKPAIQFVKQRHHRCRNMYGEITRGDYALLQDVLPPLSQLNFESWAALRRTCGRTE